MKRFIGITLLCVLGFSVAPTAFAAEAINRRDGFLLLWHSISRPAAETREKPFTDVPKGDIGSTEITFAKARGLLDDDVAEFNPDSPLRPFDALLWLFRTRNLESIDDDGKTIFSDVVKPDYVSNLVKKYHLEADLEGSSITQEQLIALMQSLDRALMTEDHEVSLYSEKFHGKGTGFGETFDMYAMTAAHRTYPHNTLVKVTNIDNGKSVIVRINDRGPYVQGRDLDLSLGAFTTIAERSKGKIRATFERLGDSTIVDPCKSDRTMRRVGRDVILTPGIPHKLALGKILTVKSTSPFVIRDIVYPGGDEIGTQTWVTGEEAFEFNPSVEGTYTFKIGTKLGKVREMQMEVVECLSS